VTEIGGGGTVVEAPPIGLKSGVVRFETQKRQAIAPQKRGNRRQLNLLLLDMEQQITAAADSKKIVSVHDAEICAFVQIPQILVAAPDIIGKCAITHCAMRRRATSL